MMDVIATQYIDESLQNAMAATNVNSIQSGDYRQVRFALGDPPGNHLTFLSQLSAATSRI
jgi:hypothetical protein